MRYEIRIDVTKIDKASLYKGEKGTYMTLDVIDVKNSQYGDTHMIKQQLSKERYQAMTEEQRKQIPILGNMKPSKFQPVETVVAEEVKPHQAQQAPAQADPLADDTLPF
jgi:hypothetical protein